MPGVNAIVAPYTRPDLVGNAPWRPALPVIGAVWLVFSTVIYWFAGIKPIGDAIRLAIEPGSGETLLGYLNRSGISFTIGAVVIAIVIFIVMAARNRAAGVDTAMMYRQIPPE
jgi:hypothetical protein